MLNNIFASFVCALNCLRTMVNMFSKDTSIVFFLRLMVSIIGQLLYQHDSNDTRHNSGERITNILNNNQAYHISQSSLIIAHITFLRILTYNTENVQIIPVQCKRFFGTSIIRPGKQM